MLRTYVGIGQTPCSFEHVSCSEKFANSDDILLMIILITCLQLVV